MELVQPNSIYKDSYTEALKEFHQEGRDLDINIDELENNFDLFIKNFNDESEGKNLKPGYVAQTTYWLIDNNQYIGRISIRHTLTEALQKLGGHIGYEIRPTQRGKGYGTKMLKLVLPYAKDLGITKALLTCDSDNIASRKIIESAGGIFENEIPGEDGKSSKLRFWIDLNS